MYLHLFIPHSPLTTAPRHLGKFGNLKFLGPLYEKDISYKTQWLQDNRRLNLKNQDWVLQKTADESRLWRMESLLAVDEILEKIFKRIMNVEKLKYTRIFYIEDNCDNLSGPTNSIDDEFTKFFSRYNFLIGVSLDGSGYIHDFYRKGRNGKVFYKYVIKAIDFLVKDGVEFNILTLVSQANVKKGKEVYKFLCDKGFFYHQYTECVEFDKKGSWHDLLESLVFCDIASQKCHQHTLPRFRAIAEKIMKEQG